MNRRLALTLLLSMGLLSCSAACGGAAASGGAKESRKPLAVGSEAPALIRVDHRGKVVAVRNGEPTLLYFYPKDGTPGCTKEACAFRDAWERYEAAGLRVVGVSIDSEQEHRKFAEEHNLPFSLIADPEHAWSDAFGVGRHTLLGGADERISFLIDKAGKIAKVYDDVEPGVHAGQVVKDAEALHIIE